MACEQGGAKLGQKLPMLAGKECLEMLANFEQEFDKLATACNLNPRDSLNFFRKCLQGQAETTFEAAIKQSKARIEKDSTIESHCFRRAHLYPSMQLPQRLRLCT